MLWSNLAVNVFCAYIMCYPTFPPPLASNTEIGPRSKRIFANRPKWPVVSTQVGHVQGHSLRSRTGKDFYAFEGIPFAEPPIENLRFHNPVPKQPGPGFVNLGPNARVECIQTEISVLYSIRGREDCLYLNVYTPEVGSTHRFPVIVYIFGGAFFSGSKEAYGPSYLMDKDVILVTMNYRLGALGFLATGDKVSPGNYGLKDQHTALQWVRDNIKALGGDPDQITLMGQSAGSASVHLHMLSPLSRGKFIRAISLSGNAFCNWVFGSTSVRESKVIEFATNLGCPTSSSELMIFCLRRIGANRLVAAETGLFEWLNYPAVNFGPVVEKYHDENSFLTRTPQEHYANRDVAKVPWITGFVRNEGNFYNILLMNIPNKFRIFDHNFDFLASLTLDYRGRGVQDLLGTSRKIRNFYFGNEKLSHKNVLAQGDMYGDRYFLTGIHRGMIEHSRIAPTYGYIFNYFGDYSTLYAAGFTPEEAGITHFDDIHYLFNNSRLRAIEDGHPDYIISKLMVDSVTSFASLGKPLMTGYSGQNETLIWEPIQPNDVKILFISNNTRQIPFPQAYLERIDFWNTLKIPL